ncbi:caspase-8-like isoform X2 [Hyperolius riggenbachi]|uniref:caspase-8-like isoform X2 n=1 Tax=Hyperolius riggenbachi TaxID=752182 RepID=UPI0035A31A64
MTDLYAKLLIIKDQLNSSEADDAFFLCRDLVRQRVHEFTELIDQLKQRGHISINNTDLVAELLYYLKRPDLLKHIGTDKIAMEEKMRIKGASKISPYRALLYELGQLVPDSTFRTLKNVFNDELTTATLDRVNSLLDAFVELEKRGVLNNELKYLKEKSTHFEKDFWEKLVEYEKKHAGTEVLAPEDLPETSEDAAGESTEAQTSEDAAGESMGVQPSRKFYKMDSKERGVCLIINNFNFETARQNFPGCEDLKNRDGTDRDVASLQDVFSKLDFLVTVRSDLGAKEILELVKSYSRKNYEKNDCFICCVLSHGNQGVVFGTDGRSTHIKELTYPFQSCLCPSLHGKPKIFFIQACQGERPQQCVPLSSDACNVSDGGNVTQDTTLIPDEPDFLLGMATTPRSTAFRDPDEGSWYIQCLCRELTEGCQSVSLNRMHPMSNSTAPA